MSRRRVVVLGGVLVRVIAAAIIAVTVFGSGNAGAQPVSTPPAVQYSPRVLSATRVAAPPVALPDAATTLLVRYSSLSVRGASTWMTGTLLLPKRRPPLSGWPLAVWSHMTTGAADRCAPSTARPGDRELTHMTSGDRIVGGLLRRGFAVMRPDFEGIGGPGPHPYLIGESLARAVIDAARAVTAFDTRIGRDVVVAGHSEGAVASLFAAAAPAAQWSGLRLRAVSAVTPPTQMGRIVDLVGGVRVAGPATRDLVGLAALMIAGGVAADPDFARIIGSGGLSVRARSLLPQVQTRCYEELSGEESFGGLAPADLLGPRGGVAKKALVAIADRNDVSHLRLNTRLPVRIDAGSYDAVAPLPLVRGLADRYRRDGVRVSFNVHPAGHTPVPLDAATAADISRWLASSLPSGNHRYP